MFLNVFKSYVISKGSTANLTHWSQLSSSGLVSYMSEDFPIVCLNNEKFAVGKKTNDNKQKVISTFQWADQTRNASFLSSPVNNEIPNFDSSSLSLGSWRYLLALLIGVAQ